MRAWFIRKKCFRLISFFPVLHGNTGIYVYNIVPGCNNVKLRLRLSCQPLPPSTSFSPFRGGWLKPWKSSPIGREDAEGCRKKARCLLMAAGPHSLCSLFAGSRPWHRGLVRCRRSDNGPWPTFPICLSIASSWRRERSGFRNLLVLHLNLFVSEVVSLFVDTDLDRRKMGSFGDFIVLHPFCSLAILN